MKRTLATLMAIVMLLSCMITMPNISASAAASGTCGENVTWTRDDEGTLTISGTGPMADYDGGFSRAPWYVSSTQVSPIKKCVVSDGVTSIGSYAFYNCKNMTSIEIADSVTSIGALAFNNCYALTAVNLSENITSIGKNAFVACTGMTSINVDENNSVYSSVDSVLFSKDKTQLIRFPAGRSGSYTVPDGVTSILEDAFRDNSLLSEVTLPEGLTTINDFGFYWCTGLTSINFPSSITNIGGNAFTHCISLTSIDVPGSVKTLNASFTQCEGAKTLTLADGVTTLNGAFSRCTGLTTVTMTNSVEEISRNAFNHCDALTDIYYYGSEQQWASTLIGTGNDVLTNVTVHYLGCQHEFDDVGVITTEPTCEADGVRSYICTKRACGYVQATEPINALGHDYSDEFTKDAEGTCEADGSTSRHCSRCDSKADVTAIPALGHDYSEEWTIDAEPNCVEDGSKSHHCSRCDSKTDVTAIPATGHICTDDWVVIIEPTNIETGLECCACSVCDEMQYREVPALMDDVPDVIRLSGKSRYLTANAISDKGWETADTIVLANGLNYADALAGVPLAYKYDAPILLTAGKATLESEVMAQIEKLAPKKIVLLGGFGAISTEIETALSENYTVERVRGTDRYATALKISEKVVEWKEIQVPVATSTDAPVATPTDTTTESIPVIPVAFVVTGTGYADALSISPYAAMKGYPIVYANPNTGLTEDTIAFLKSAEKIYLIGGAGVVTQVTVDQLAGRTIERISGKNRYLTSFAIAEKFDSEFGNYVMFATGTNFPDALAGGVFGAKIKAPLLLTHPNGAIEEIKDYVLSKNLSRIYILGGKGAVPDSIIENIYA